MNDEQLDDLKQFIDSRISQTEARFGERISGSEAKVEQNLKGLRSEMHDGFAGIGEAIEQINQHHDDRDKDEQRLTKLEHQIAA
jgi:hypothetical protein